MSIHSFISKNIIDLGESDEKPEVVGKKSAVLAPKSFIHPDDESLHAINLPETPAQQGYAVSNSSDYNDAVNHFSKFLMDNNQPGVDYLEYMNAKDALSVLPNEDQRYKVAFVTLVGAGLTKNIILKSATHYLDLVKSEVSGFNNAFANTQKSDIADKETRINTLADQIKNAVDEMNKLKGEVNESKRTLGSKNSAFNKAANEIITKIQTEIDKVNQYI